jgi:hypothetical protein
MRIVRYESQERVDHPDITAMSFLVLGEFRRSIRGLLLGPDDGSRPYPNAIIRGFAVEPESPASSNVVVKLDPGGGEPLAFAIGGEDVGAHVDYGQLIGGSDMAGRLEGNAQQTLDFTGQPSDTYIVQMRFVYQESVEDNRAFWNEGVKEEFVSPMETRHAPLFELRAVGATTNDEWIDLAEVVWGGATIGAGDITDIRTFAFEGSAPFQADWFDEPGAMPDFDRDVDRAAHGINEVYPVLRALARQIQDIKGQNIGDEKWDWFSAVPFSQSLRQLFLKASPKFTLNSSNLGIIAGQSGSYQEFTGGGSENAFNTMLLAATVDSRWRLIRKKSFPKQRVWITVNAWWDAGDTQWKKDSNGTRALGLLMEHDGFKVLIQEEATNAWAEDGWTTNAAEALESGLLSPGNLTVNGSFTPSKGYLLHSRQIFDSAGAPTWTRPDGVRAIKVTVVGGGGGGGGCEGGSEESASGGGGGGGASVAWITSPPASQVLAVGAGGSAGSGSNPGGAGGTSSFDTVQATGGAGGAIGVNAAGNAISNGGLGGVGSGGDLNIRGDRGDKGLRISGVAMGIADGGGSLLAGAGSSVASAGYGGGGGGGFASFSGDTGQTGQDGVVIVEEYV